MSRDDLAARLLLALERRDDLALASVLNPDVRMVVDTGDHTGAELRGRAAVTHALTDLHTRHPDASLLTVHVNGGPGLALRRSNGRVVGVLAIDSALDLGLDLALALDLDLDRSDVIDRLWLSMAPGKLAHWNRRRPAVD